MNYFVQKNIFNIMRRNGDEDDAVAYLSTINNAMILVVMDTREIKVIN